VVRQSCTPGSLITAPCTWLTLSTRSTATPHAAPPGQGQCAWHGQRAVGDHHIQLETDGADLVGYQQHAIWLTRGELIELIGGLRNAILPVLANPPRGYLLSPILVPIEEPPDDPGPS